MTNAENKESNGDDADHGRRAALKRALLLPYVVPVITTIALGSSTVQSQAPSVTGNDVPPPVNEEDPTN